jgi:hypothetical protein
MKLLDQSGRFKVFEQHRLRANKPLAIHADWIEYQVREGRRIVSRHERLFDAINDAKARNQALWDAIELE